MYQQPVIVPLLPTEKQALEALTLANRRAFMNPGMNILPLLAIPPL
jgi:hypothetical protein